MGSLGKSPDFGIQIWWSTWIWFEYCEVYSRSTSWSVTYDLMENRNVIVFKWWLKKCVVHHPAYLSIRIFIIFFHMKWVDRRVLELNLRKSITSFLFQRIKIILIFYKNLSLNFFFTSTNKYVFLLFIWSIHFTSRNSDSHLVQNQISIVFQITFIHMKKRYFDIVFVYQISYFKRCRQYEISYVRILSMMWSCQI